MVAEPGSGRELEEALVDSLRSNETRDALRKGCRGDRDGGWGLPDLLPDLSLRALEVMVAQAIVNFFENDVFGALKQFLTRAKVPSACHHSLLLERFFIPATRGASGRTKRG